MHVSDDPPRLRGGGPPLPRPAPPPRATAVACRRSPRASSASSIASARCSSTRWRSPAGTTTSSCSPASGAIGASGRTTGCTRTGASTRPTTRASTSSRSRSCRCTAGSGTARTASTARRPSTSTRRSSRSSWSGSETQGSLLPRDVGPREAIDWYWRPTNQVRAILEALAEAGRLGIAPAGGQPPGLRPGRAAVLARDPRGAARRGGAAATPPARPLPRQRPARSVGQPGAVGRRDRATPRFGRPRRAALVEAGRLVPVSVEGLKGQRFVVAEDLPYLEQAERELAAGDPPGGASAGGDLRRAARPPVLGPRPAAPALRVRLRLGGLRPGGQAALGLLRPAAALRRPARRPDRAAHRAPGRDPARRGDLVGGRLRPAGGAGLRGGARRRAPRAPRLRRP